MLKAYMDLRNLSDLRYSVNPYLKYDKDPVYIV